MEQIETFEYDRPKAVAYAHQWAYFRNPDFYDFSQIGGDCTNFASQCLYAGSGIMNYTPIYGWYYLSSYDRTASWTGVEYLYRFLTRNKNGVGPYASDAPITAMQPGDLIQLALDREYFQHTPVVVEVRGVPSPETIFIAAHSRDSDCRPLNSYSVQNMRFLHIEGVRYQPTRTAKEALNTSSIPLLEGQYNAQKAGL